MTTVGYTTQMNTNAARLFKLSVRLVQLKIVLWSLLARRLFFNMGTKVWWKKQYKIDPMRMTQAVSVLFTVYLFSYSVAYIYISGILKDSYASAAGVGYLLAAVYYGMMIRQMKSDRKFTDRLFKLIDQIDESHTAELRYWQTKAGMKQGVE